MKPSLKLHTLKEKGFDILRPQLRRHGNKLLWTVAVYTGGWSNFSGNRYETQDEAYSEIERLCAENAKFIDERFLPDNE